MPPFNNSMGDGDISFAIYLSMGLTKFLKSRKMNSTIKTIPGIGKYIDTKTLAETGIFKTAIHLIRS